MASIIIEFATGLPSVITEIIEKYATDEKLNKYTNNIIKRVSDGDLCGSCFREFNWNQKWGEKEICAFCDCLPFCWECLGGCCGGVCLSKSCKNCVHNFSSDGFDCTCPNCSAVMKKYSHSQEDVDMSIINITNEYNENRKNGERITFTEYLAKYD